MKNTRERLLRTATNLFAQRGYADTSIREIGNKAGICTSVLYHYFRNKEEMLFEIIDSSSNELIQNLQEICEDITDPAECLREMLMAHMVHFSLKRKKETQIMASDNHLLTGKRLQICRQKQRGIYDLYRQKLKQLSESGRMNSIDQTVAVFSIFGMINSFYRWYREGGRLSKVEVAQNILQLISRGILKQ